MFDPRLEHRDDDDAATETEWRYECESCGFKFVIDLAGEEFDEVTGIVRRGTFDRIVGEHEASHA